MKTHAFKNLKLFFAIVISLFLTKAITNPSLLKNKITSFINSHLHQKQTPTPVLSKPEIRFISPHFLPKESSTPFPISSPLPSPTIFFNPSPLPSPTEIIISPTKVPPSPTPKPKFSCPSFSGENYDTATVIVKNSTPISLRRDITLPPLIPISVTLSLIDGQIVDPDPKVPQFSTVFSPKRTPRFLAAYKAEGELRGPQSTDVEILELETNPGESLRFPKTGYDIGGGNAAMVLNASEDKITFKIGREDNVVLGYTLYFEGVCLDKNLEALYQRLNSEGRNSLPAIKVGQIFGWAKSDRLKIALRDTGTFLDLRLVDKATGESVWK
jgi:hypothetical protein